MRLAGLCLLFPAGLTAQTPATGAIAGRVFDPAGRVVPNAQVVALDEDTHVERSVATGGDGVFHVQLLPAGKYDLTVKATGFAASIIRGVEVTVSRTDSMDVRLIVASSTVEVQVNDSERVADLESSAIGELVDEKAIQLLPLANRNFTQLLALAPGVIVDLPTPTVLGHGSQNVASDGATPTANNIQFNGVDANNITENSAANSESAIVGVAVPAPDTIQEFRVQTANFDAAYGRESGASVDLISKSGTDRFHGSVWEFVRNDIFNANDFFSKLAGQPRAELKHNQFGAALGGPIRRNKTFFFLSYQGLFEVNGLGNSSSATLPLLTQDRSAHALGAQFCPAGHLNSLGQPSAGYFTQAGGAQVACDGSNINPVALAVLNAKLPNGQFAVPSPQIALPNSGPDPTDQFPVGLSLYEIPAHYSENQFTVNLDDNLGSHDILAGRFFYARAPRSIAFSPNGAANVPGWGTDALDRNTLFVLSDTHTFSPRLLSVARFGFVRFDGVSTIQNPFTARSLGISTPTGPAGNIVNSPGIWIGGLMLGDAGTPSEWQVTNTFTWQDTVAFTHGKHNARFGAEVRRSEVAIDFPVEADGLLQVPSFEDFLLGQSAVQNGSPQGVSNVGTTQSGGGIFRRNLRYSDLALFAQDDIRLTTRLTVNAGVRYEIFGAPTETAARLANFNANIAVGNPGPNNAYSGFTVPSNFQGTVPTGVIRTPWAGLYQTPLGDVAPRLGFVWQMTDSPALVLRGGYGWYFDQHAANLAEVGLAQPPYSTLNIVFGATNGAATLQNPYVTPVLPPSAYPVFVPRSAASPLPFTQGTDPNVKDGLTQAYNVNLQYAFKNSYLLQLGYVGSASRNRPGQIEFNQSLLASPQNPINGATNNSVNNVTTRQPFQGVPQGSLFTVSQFIANFNSLQASISKRLKGNMHFQANYTWSKNLDEVNGEGGLDTFELQLPTNDQRNLRRSSYGLAGDDRDQRLVANFTWTAPKFQSLPKGARYVLSGWELAGVGVIQSGAALSIFDGNAGSVYGNFNNRAQASGKNPSTKGSLFSRVVGDGRYLEANAFMRAPEAPSGTSIADEDFGNSPVGYVRGPGQHSVDFAVERVFPMKEAMNFRFRAESFNLTNTPQFANPNTSLGYGDPNQPAVASSSFGQIFGEQGGPHPRIIQFAAKLQF